MRHALEPDHLAAVTTLVTEERSTRRAALLGTAWGVGHSAALLVVGLALALFRTGMSEKLGELFEFGVALMLVALGARAIRRSIAVGISGPVTVHRHGSSAHAHASGASHVHVGRWTLATRPLLVGLVHGLAGSGSLTVLVIAGLPSTTARIVYIALFGFGSVLGMALVSGIAGWPLAKMARHRAAMRYVTFAAGSVSAGLGVCWGYPFVAHWLSA
jgi:hypothetical protein